MKQILLSLCKACLQSSQSVETIIRIFTDLQVEHFPVLKLFLHWIIHLGNDVQSIINRRSSCWYISNIRYVYLFSFHSIERNQFDRLDIELSPSDEATSKENYKQRFFQLINNSEVCIDKTNLRIFHDQTFSICFRRPYSWNVWILKH